MKFVFLDGFGIVLLNTSDYLVNVIYDIGIEVEPGQYIMKINL